MCLIVGEKYESRAQRNTLGVQISKETEIGLEKT